MPRAEQALSQSPQMTDDDDAADTGPELESLRLTGWEGVVFQLEDEPEESPWASE